MTITARLWLGFGALALLISLVSINAVLSMNAVQAEFALVLKDRYPKIVAFNEIKGEVDQIARSLRNMLLMTAPAPTQPNRAAWELVGEPI